MAGSGSARVSPERALTDELLGLDDERDRVVAIDMALAARITSRKRLRTYAGGQRGRRREATLMALVLADERSLSPRESRMRLVWMLDAGLPRPLVNRPVYGSGGTFLGMPDLLDAGAGVAGEYDGADHRDRERHRKDVRRESDFRSHGLEVFTIVAGDSVAVQVERMRTARERALRERRPRRGTTTPGPRSWTPYERDLDEELDERDAAYLMYVSGAPG